MINYKCREFVERSMRLCIAASFACSLLAVSVLAVAQDDLLERLLRVQVFNKAFEGFDYYHVTIEEDQAQTDGSREVTAVASGRFLENTKRMKVLFLIVGEQVVGGQVLEGTGLPACLTPQQSRT